MKSRRPKSSSLISTRSSDAPEMSPWVLLPVVNIRRAALAAILHGPAPDTTVGDIQTAIVRKSPLLPDPWEMAVPLGS